MLEERLRTIDGRHPAGRHVLVDLTLHHLPPFRPEPALIGRNRQERTQLDPPVLLLDDLELGTGLVEMKPSPISAAASTTADGWMPTSA